MKLRTSMADHAWCGTPPDLPHIVRSVSRAIIAVAMRRRDAQAPAPLSERAEVQRLEGLPTNIYRTEPPNAFYGGGWAILIKFSRPRGALERRAGDEMARTRSTILGVSWP